MNWAWISFSSSRSFRENFRPHFSRVSTDQQRAAAEGKKSFLKHSYVYLHAFVLYRQNKRASPSERKEDKRLPFPLSPHLNHLLFPFRFPSLIRRVIRGGTLPVVHCHSFSPRRRCFPMLFISHAAGKERGRRR